MITFLCAAWWPPIVQTALGGFLAIAGGVLGSWLNWRKERKAVSAAFAGELEGLIDVINWRETSKLIRLGFVLTIDERPFPVFEANIDKIGVLPAPLAGEVSVFYSRARGIFQDFLTLNKGEPIFNQVEFRERLANDIDEIKPRASALISKLRR
jgi:hypothetical protein